MIGKPLFTVENSNNPTYILNYTKPNLSLRILNKMKNYRMTNFNFILDKKKDESKDDNVIQEKTMNGEDIKSKESSIIEKNNINNYQSEKIFNVNRPGDTYSQKEITKNDTKTVIEQINGLMSSINTQDKEKNNVNEIILKGYNNKIEYSYIFNNKKTLSKKNKHEKNNKYIGMKKQKNVDIGIQTNESDFDKDILKPKFNLIKLVQKYSYEFILNTFLKNCANNIPEEGIYYNKEVELYIENLIKEIGIKKMMRIILSIDNSKKENNKVYHNFNNKNEGEIREEYYGNNTPNLDKYGDNITKDTINTDNTDEEKDYKKHNNKIINLNEDNEDGEVMHNYENNIRYSNFNINSRNMNDSNNKNTKKIDESKEYTTKKLLELFKLAISSTQNK